MDLASPTAPQYRRPFRSVRSSGPMELEARNLTLRSMWRGLKAESAALMILCAYVLFEYLRPQEMYPIIDVIPWGLTTIALSTLGALSIRNGAKGVNMLDGLFLLFIFVLSASMVTAYSPAAALKGWSTAATIALLYFCVKSILNTPNRLLLFTIVFVIINLKFSQHATRSFVTRGFSFAHWGVAGSGFFKNSGELAMQMGVGFFISLCVLLALRPYVQNRRRWWALMVLFPGTMMITVVASSSRGGQLALLAVLVLMLIKPPQLVKKLASLIAVFGFLALVLPDEQLDRFGTAGEDDTSLSRKAYWEIGRLILDDNPMGIGYMNWAPFYRDFYWNPSIFPRVEASHNTYLDAFVELGYQGGVLFFILLLVAVAMNLTTQARLKKVAGPASSAVRGIARGVNLGLLSASIAGFFMSVLYYPVFWLALAMTSAAYQVSHCIVKSAPRSEPHRVAPARRRRPLTTSVA